MSYDTMRHLADSWGLLFMLIVFLTLFGWTFRSDAKRAHKRAAMMIFDDEDDHHG